MMINWNRIIDNTTWTETATGTYKDMAYGIIKVLESAKNTPYDDGAHVPTIGIGVDLDNSTNRDKVLEFLGIRNHDSDETKKYKDQIVTALAAWSSAAFYRCQCCIRRDWFRRGPVLLTV
jgi:GH24 family phage-related lysozyme (muramidase)